jgi:CRP-like cAMP-binding protein
MDARREEGMLTTIEKMIALKSADFFSQTSGEVLADLAEILTEVEIPAGDAVFAKDEPGSSMYLIVQGRVRVHDGDLEYGQFGEGETFGEMALLDRAPRSASITALTDTHLLELGQEPFYVLLEDYSDIGRHIMQLLTRRLRDLMEAESG